MEFPRDVPAQLYGEGSDNFPAAGLGEVLDLPPGLEARILGKGLAAPEWAPSQTSTEDASSADGVHADPELCAAARLPPMMERVFRIIEEIAGETFALKFRKVEASLTSEAEDPHLNIKLHLAEDAVATMVAPLMWLEYGISRDMVGHGCLLLSMETAMWGSRLDLTCVPGSELACWDLMRWGRCPRGARCRWSHPQPISVCITVAGLPCLDAGACGAEGDRTYLAAPTPKS